MKIRPVNSDYCALNASTQSDLKGSVDQFSKACKNLAISTKTEVQHQPAPEAAYFEPHITVNGQRLRIADKFIYLVSTLSRSTNIDKEVVYRIVRASAAFDRLTDKV